MKYKKLLFDLIDYLDAFESLHDGGSHEPEIKGFADFLSWRCGKKKKQEEEVVSVTRERAAGAKNIARGVSLLHRYSRFYIKKALTESPLQTEDEYTYLVSLMNGESMTKTELNNLNAMEKTSGAEVMRRLLKANLIEQRPDEEDRRSMRVSITPEGRKVLVNLFPNLRLCAETLVSALSDEQLTAFDHLLWLLCECHNEMFTGKHDAELTDLHAETCGLKQSAGGALSKRLYRR